MKEIALYELKQHELLPIPRWSRERCLSLVVTEVPLPQSSRRKSLPLSLFSHIAWGPGNVSTFCTTAQRGGDRIHKPKLVWTKERRQWDKHMKPNGFLIHLLLMEGYVLMHQGWAHMNETVCSIEWGLAIVRNQKHRNCWMSQAIYCPRFTRWAQSHSL